MLHLRPPASEIAPHQNVYEEWLQTLSEHQFYEHVAGRLHGPEVGKHRPAVLDRALRVAIFLLSVAIIYLVATK